jgi:hypothetical protein
LSGCLFYDVTSQKTVLFIVTAVRPSDRNLETCLELLMSYEWIGLQQCVSLYSDQIWETYIRTNKKDHAIKALWGVEAYLEVSGKFHAAAV